MSDNLSLNGTYTGSIHGHRQSHDYGYGNRDENIYRDVSYHANQVSLGEQIREVNTSVEKNGAANSLATEKLGAAGQLTTEKTTAGLGIQAEKTAAAINLAIEKTHAASQLAVEKTAAANQYTTMVGFKDALLQASVNTSDIRKDIAECCCEMKELILREACATREFVQGLDTLNKAVSLVDAKNELLALRLASGNGNAPR